MTNPNAFRTRLLTVFGVFALVILALALPTPLRDWFVDGSVGGIPADVIVMALIILVTPVTVISIIVARFNVDFADEVSEETSNADAVLHTQM